MFESDVIGGFPTVQPNCAGCGKPLVLENAWMTDGCPCNHPLGINNMNETRWRLLMRLQQLQSMQVESMRAALELAINSVECASVNAVTGEPLPWYRAARRSLGRPVEESRAAERKGE